ncbi:MAG: MOSC domain-containing protein [Jatrophihabitans sp.]|uniref:MOSC domain-containing protein n=1 Tax=Jatrophihabitans sp. TaxID=1932789 RepID=UPI003F8196F2
MDVLELWRFPVKSMVGERLTHAHLDTRGVRGDRLWAVHDVERDVTVSARRLPALLRLRARYAVEPDASSGPGRVPPVVVTLPDGGEVRSDDPGVHDALSAALDRDVRLQPLGAAVPMPWRERLTSGLPSAIARDFGLDRDERLPDFSRMALRPLLQYATYGTPPGTFVDLSPVHLLTDASLRAVRDQLGDADAPDARRFRPNVFVHAPGDALVESGWAGGAVRLGGTAQVRVDMPTVRCVIPSRAQDDLPTDRRLTRAVAETGDRFLGVYATVDRAGVVAVGDQVRFEPPVPPGPIARAARRGRDTALTGVLRLAELARRLPAGG